MHIAQIYPEIVPQSAESCRTDEWVTCHTWVCAGKTERDCPDFGISDGGHACVTWLIVWHGWMSHVTHACPPSKIPKSGQSLSVFPAHTYIHTHIENHCPTEHINILSSRIIHMCTHPHSTIFSAAQPQILNSPLHSRALALSLSHTDNPEISIPQSERWEVGSWGRDPFSRNLMSPTPRRKWYLTTGRRFH